MNEAAVLLLYHSSRALHKEDLATLQLFSQHMLAGSNEKLQLKDSKTRTAAPARQELLKLWHSGTPLDAGLTLKSCPLQEVKADSLQRFSGLKLIATATTKDEIQ